MCVDAYVLYSLGMICHSINLYRNWSLKCLQPISICTCYNAMHRYSKKIESRSSWFWESHVKSNLDPGPSGEIMQYRSSPYTCIRHYTRTFPCQDLHPKRMKQWQWRLMTKRHHYVRMQTPFRYYTCCTIAYIFQLCSNSTSLYSQEGTCTS